MIYSLPYDEIILNAFNVFTCLGGLVAFKWKQSFPPFTATLKVINRFPYQLPGGSGITFD